MVPKICHICLRGDTVVHKYRDKNYILTLDIMLLTATPIFGKILFLC